MANPEPKEPVDLSLATPENAQARIDAFIKDFGELRTKYKVDIAATPGFIPNERGTWELAVNMFPTDVAAEFLRSPKQFIP